MLTGTRRDQGMSKLMSLSVIGVRNTRVRDVLVFASLSFTGCGGDSATPMGSGGTSGTTTTQSGSTGVGGSGGAAAVGGGGSSGQVGGTTKSGKIGQVQLISFFGSNPERFVSARFVAAERENTCDFQNFGDCVVSTECGAPAGAVAFVSAGSIGVTCDNPVIDVTLAPESDNQYTTQTFSTGFAGGRTIQISALGATVPAFSAQVTTQKPLLVDSPAPDASGIITAPSSSDLTITFSRGAPGAQAVLSGASANNGSLWCESDSTTGRLTVSAAALAALGAGVQLQMLTAQLTTIPDQDWNIDISVLLQAYTSDLKNPVLVQTH